MSMTMHLECDTCRESLWIGQDGYIYTAEHATMRNLEKFLIKHKSERHGVHILFFRDSRDSRFIDGQDGWTGI